MTRRHHRIRDPEYLLFVKSLPCLVGIDCAGKTEADHVGSHGIGRKGHDCEAVPLCTKHHQSRHARTGYFRDFDKVAMREWKIEAIRKTQSRRGIK